MATGLIEAQLSVISKRGTKEEWYNIWLKTEVGSELDKIATRKLEEFGFFVNKQAKEDLAHQEALRLAAIAQTEEEWHEVWLRSKSGTELSKRAKATEDSLFRSRMDARTEVKHARAEELAARLPTHNSGTKEEWHEIWLNAKCGSELDKIATKKMAEFGYFADKQAREDADHLIAEELATSAQTEKEWHEVWLKSKSGTKLSKKAKAMEDKLFKARMKERQELNQAKAEALALELR